MQTMIRLSLTSYPFSGEGSLPLTGGWSLKLDFCQRNGNGVGSNASEVKNELALEIVRPLHRHLGLFQRLINEQRALLDLFNWILEVGRRAFA